MRRDFEKSPSFRVEVTNEWSHTITLSIRLHGMDRDNFIFVSASEKCIWMSFLKLLLFPNTALFCNILYLFNAVFCVAVCQGFIVYTSIIVCVPMHRL